jgi:hypothetical protein
MTGREVNIGVLFCDRDLSRASRIPTTQGRSKTMKRALALIMMASLVFACSSDSDSPTAPSAEVIEGTFQLQELRVTGGGIDGALTPPVATGQVVATADGRFTATVGIPSEGFEESASGTYSVSGTTLILTYDDGTVEEWFISEDRNLVAGTTTEEGVTLGLTYARA